jgi:hypothetical protein
MPLTIKRKNEINAAAIIWLESKKDSNQWDLSHDQINILLGGISQTTYKSWLKAAIETHAVYLNIDVEERLSLLLGIHKAIALSAPKGYETNFWVAPINHPLFKNKSAKDTLLSSGSILTLLSVRDFFEKNIL